LWTEPYAVNKGDYLNELMDDITISWSFLDIFLDKMALLV
jgi:hypothetical protein